MNKPRKHAEIIKAWADGKAIQLFDESSGEWLDLVIDRPAWIESISYRVKPDSVWYRVGLMKRLDGAHYTTVIDSDDQADDFESLKSFVRWLTDWIEVEV